MTPKKSSGRAVLRFADTMPNSYAIVAGRLLEVRISESIRTRADVDAWFDGVRAALTQVPPGKRQVVVADWRACSLMSDEAAERALFRLKQTNSNMDRSAALATAASPIAVLQFLRLCRSSDVTGNRRLFTDPQELSEWLGEVLTDVECERLKIFLADQSARSGTGTV
jgi:hypothetical protein